MISKPEDQTSPNYFRIALQSALAAALFLGLPAGLLLWLVIVDRLGYFVNLKPLIGVLNKDGLYSICIVVISSMVWSYMLARISGHRPWWWIAIATALGILAAWFSPFSNIDGILNNYNPAIPTYLNYAASMVGLIGSVTLFVGLAYGLILHSIKAALTIGLTTCLVSVLTLLLTIYVFDRMGVRVGTGHLAMPRVTAVNLMTSAIMGGMVLGLGFSKFVEDKRHSADSS